MNKLRKNRFSQAHSILRKTVFYRLLVEIHEPEFTTEGKGLIRFKRSIFSPYSALCFFSELSIGETRDIKIFRDYTMRFKFAEIRYRFKARCVLRFPFLKIWRVDLRSFSTEYSKNQEPINFKHADFSCMLKRSDDGDNKPAEIVGVTKNSITVRIEDIKEELAFLAGDKVNQVLLVHTPTGQDLTLPMEVNNYRVFDHLSLDYKDFSHKSDKYAICYMTILNQQNIPDFTAFFSKPPKISSVQPHAS